MNIHRSHPQEQFTIIPNETLRDQRLSYAARGVLVEILSRPDDWQTNADALWRQGRCVRGKAGEGRDALRAVFAELEACGYLRRVRTRTAQGRMVTDLHFYDIPADGADDGTGSRRSYQGKHASSQVAPTYGSPGVGSPGVGSPGVGSPGVSTKTDYEDQKNKDQSNKDPLSPMVAKLRAAVPGATERECRQVAEKITSDPGVRYPAAYLATAIERGYAPSLIAEAHHELLKADRPPWCGNCSDENARQITLPDDRVMRCPACHPRAAAGVAS